MPTSLPRSASSIPRTRVTDDVRDTESRSLWVWWHLLSLDAPTVAVVWCWFFGFVSGVEFPWTTLPTLALGTWCVYVADRLLDGWRTVEATALRDRHWFYMRHRKTFIIAWAIAAIPLAYLIFFRTEPRVRTDDIILCLIGVAYFLLIHGRSLQRGGTRLFPQWLPKELAVGFLFAIATAVPAWVRLTGDRTLLAAAIFTFGAACWLNCVAIQTWEDAEAAAEVMHAILSPRHDKKHSRRSVGLTEYLGRHRTAFTLAVGTLGVALAVATANRRFYPLFAAVALSALLFLGLDRYGHRFRALTLRIAADVALLTPLIFLLCVR